MPSPLVRRVLQLARAAVGSASRESGTPGARRSGARAPSAYPGDFTGRVRPVYAPDLDGTPDPGEIVWAWVPFEEGDGRGKDRPVLLVGHDGAWLLGLVLSSRDHDARPGRRGEEWLDLGPGAWDAQGRPSEVRLDRVVRLDPAAVRREGAVLERRRFDDVVAALH